MRTQRRTLNRLAFGTLRPRQQRLDCPIDANAASNDGMHGFGDWHLDTGTGRGVHHGCSGIDAFGHRAAVSEHLVQQLSLAERATEAHVARLWAAAGEQEIAE